MSTIIQTTKANGTCSAKQTRPATVRAHVPSAEPVAPMIEQALTAATNAVSELPNPCTEREALAVTIGGARFSDVGTITALIADWAPEAPGDVLETQINIEIDGEPSVFSPEQARTAAVQLHQLADHVQELAEKVEPTAKKLPYWQTQPCPAWCGATHKDRDYQEDRDHYTSFRNIDLTLYDAEGEGGHDNAPGMMIVSASQHYRQAEPEIAINVPVAGNRARRYLATDEHDVYLTVDEARQLRDQLSRLLGMLDDGAK